MYFNSNLKKHTLTDETSTEYDGRRAPNNNLCPVSGNNLNLNSDISEEDRAFFLVLDMAFSQHNHRADLGFYYECECENTFNFNRLQMASEHFNFYQCHQAVKPNQMLLVKYVNVANMILTSSDSNSKQIMASILREFNLLKKYSGDKNSGLVDVFFMCSRIPNVYYIFLERPDETLEEYIQRRSNNTIRRLASQSNRASSLISMSSRIPMKETKFIMKSVAITLLQLHQNGIVHGQLNTHSVFIFRKDNVNQSGIEDRMCVKLANLTFSTIFDRSLEDYADSQQSMFEEVLKSRELNALYEVALRVGENTEFVTHNDRELYFEATRILSTPNNGDNETLTGEQEEDSKVSGANKSTVDRNDKTNSDRRLEFFAESLWFN